jgi:hypothetical protein
MFEPTMENPYPTIKTVKIVYDNNAIYISALLYDNEPDKIKEITNRDVLEYQILVYINGFNDGQQDFRFL